MKEVPKGIDKRAYRSLRNAVTDAIRIRQSVPWPFNGPLFDRWIVMKSNAYAYNASFRDILSGKVGVDEIKGDGLSLTDAFKSDFRNLSKTNYLEKIVEEKRHEKGKVKMLDFMGYGTVIRDLGVQGLAVALTDKRSFIEKRKDKKIGNGFISGDIRRVGTWRTIKEWAHNQGDDYMFDFILSRPAGGSLYLPKDYNFYEYALRSLYVMLSNDRGYLLVDFPYEMLNLVQHATPVLNRIQGVEARFYSDKIDNSFMLIKHDNAPKSLPRLNLFGF